MPRSAEDLLGDVLRYGGHVRVMVAGKTYADYAAELKLRLAVERCLIVVGEALRVALRRHPDLGIYIADLRRATGLRDRLVHDYGNITGEVIWSVAVTHLPNLVEQVQAALEDELEDLEEEWHE